MAAQVTTMQVYTPEQMEQAIHAGIVQGFTVANRTPTTVTMVKPKQFSVLWAVIGLVVCILPLLIYLIVYASESDKVIEIQLVADPSQAGVAPAAQTGDLPPAGFCPRCGVAHEADAIFCAACGQRLAVDLAGDATGDQTSS